MYKKLENDFKKESKYNKESRKFLIIYIVAALISISLKINFKLNILFMILILIILLFLFLTIKAAIFDRINILKKDGKIIEEKSGAFPFGLRIAQRCLERNLEIYKKQTRKAICLGVKYKEA